MKKERKFEKVDIGLLKKEESDIYVTWTALCRSRDKIHGGIPADPKTIEKWIKAKIAKGKLTLTDEEQQALVEKTITEIASIDDAAKSSRCVFKTDTKEGLYLEGRQIKACIKEAISALHFTNRSSKKRKITKQDIQHGLHVEENKTFLGKMTPDGHEESVAHVTGPQGPRSCFKCNDYVENAEFSFTVKYHKNNELTDKNFLKVLAATQDVGIGANRSQGKGKFDIVEIYKVSE